jgi:hypothetical protein
MEEQKRLRVSQRTVSVAFPLAISGVIQTSVFAYLPTSMQSGFPFLVNADFILVLSRQDMVSPSENMWNAWMLSLVAPTFLEGFQNLVNRQDNVRYEAFRYLLFLHPLIL